MSKIKTDQKENVQKSKKDKYNKKMIEFVESNVPSSMEFVKYFIELGADDWDAGLNAAYKSGNKDMIDFFIEKGANVVHWSEYGYPEDKAIKELTYLFENATNDEEKDYYYNLVMDAGDSLKRR